MVPDSDSCAIRVKMDAVSSPGIHWAWKFCPDLIHFQGRPLYWNLNGTCFSSTVYATATRSSHFGRMLGICSTSASSRDWDAFSTKLRNCFAYSISVTHSTPRMILAAASSVSRAWILAS